MLQKTEISDQWMARVELQWSTSRCKLRALSQRRLPVIVRTVHGYNGLNDVDQLCTGQVKVNSIVNLSTATVFVAVMFY